MISTWITAALRDEQFFSLAELNRAIREKLELFNHKLFQKKEGSRISLFLEEEKPFLTPLPATRFELADWRQATVQFKLPTPISNGGLFFTPPGFTTGSAKGGVRSTIISGCPPR